MRMIARRLAFYVAAAWVAITVNFFIPRRCRATPSTR